MSERLKKMKIITMCSSSACSEAGFGRVSVSLKGSGLVRGFFSTLRGFKGRTPSLMGRALKAFLKEKNLENGTLLRDFFELAPNMALFTADGAARTF